MQPMKLRILSKHYIEDRAVSYTLRIALSQTIPVENSRWFIDVPVTGDFFDSVDVGDEFDLSFAPAAPESSPEPSLEHQEAPSELPAAPESSPEPSLEHQEAPSELPPPTAT